ncbi:MAG: ATP-binding protein [Saprospiraceae bacterium]|nr:ATP-binding protein [Saprospiraceae bacterium]
MINRILLQQVQARIRQSNKVVILYGARQVGKTTLSNEVLANLVGKTLRINADQFTYSEILSSRDLTKLKGLVSGYDNLFIDEAQRIPDIGINLKILHDELSTLKILVTGSSSLELANRIREPLTGRTWTFKLYPISIPEFQKYLDLNDFEVQLQLEEWMRFGSYPELLLLNNYNDKIAYLEEVRDAYLYKDIFALGNIRYPEKLRQLLRLLSYQIGNLVSIHELATSLQVNRDTIINYIDLLEKAFVIFRLKGLSRNLRKEVTSMDKIYFLDLGTRNSLIENYSELQNRNDTGALWENLLLIERIKKNEYSKFYANQYFWRTHTGAELDYVEEKDGVFHGFEFKWGKKRVHAPQTWLNTYPDASYQLINQNNFLDFIS